MPQVWDKYTNLPKFTFLGNDWQPQISTGYLKHGTECVGLDLHYWSRDQGGVTIFPGFNAK